MRQIKALTFVVLLLFLPIQTLGQRPSSLEQLTETGQRAYQTLLSADQFEGDAQFKLSTAQAKYSPA